MREIEIREAKMLTLHYSACSASSATVSEYERQENDQISLPMIRIMELVREWSYAWCIWTRYLEKDYPRCRVLFSVRFAVYLVVDLLYFSISCCPCFFTSYFLFLFALLPFMLRRGPGRSWRGGRGQEIKKKEY